MSSFSNTHQVVACARAKAKLEPYLGFLHSVQVGNPSLARATWAHKVYGGRLEYRPWEASSVIDVSIRGKQEDMLTGSFVGWVLRNVPGKILETTVYTPL
jgi:hypothetical protein